jgi:DNA (cytosine-5)-methyltransferase 1
MKINYLDLFSGIGGFSLGLERAGVEIGNHYFSEIDKYATAVYQKHFPQAKGLGDVSTIKSFSELGRIDLITFGFPCQDLSVAGRGAGFDGNRSVLFYEATRIIRETRPTHFIFENVKGLLSNDGGRTFEKVLHEIADIGLYDCEWQLCNTCWFLPQNRERIYFIGHLADKSRPKVFPITDRGNKLCKESKIKIIGSVKNPVSKIAQNKSVYDSSGISPALLAGDYKDPKRIKINQVGNLMPDGKYKNRHRGRIYSPDGLSPTLHTCAGGNLEPKIILSALTRQRSDELKKARKEHSKKFGKDHTPWGGREIVPRTDGMMNTLTTTQGIEQCLCVQKKYYMTDKNIAHVNREFGSKAQDITDADISPTLTAAMGMGGGNVPYFNDEIAIRKLTPTECERLQGFPDDWTAGHSDSQRYKMLGNAVSVPVPEYIFRKLYKC